MQEEANSRTVNILKLYGNNIDKVVFSTHIVGTTFRELSQEFLGILSQNKYILNYVRIILQRERNNEFDINAVKVNISLPWYKSLFFAGYIPESESELVAFALDNIEYEVFTYDPRIYGGTEDKENYGLFFKYRIIPREKIVNGKIRI